MAITLDQLEKDFGDDAKAVYKEIALGCGHGFASGFPDLAEPQSKEGKDKLKEI